MLVEAQILGGQKGVHHMAGKVVHVDDGAVLRAHQGGDVGTVLIVNGAGLRQVGELVHVQGLPGGHVEIHIGKAAQRQCGHDGHNENDPLDDLFFALHGHPSCGVVCPAVGWVCHAFAGGGGKFAQVGEKLQNGLVKR